MVQSRRNRVLWLPAWQRSLRRHSVVGLLIIGAATGACSRAGFRVLAPPRIWCDPLIGSGIQDPPGPYPDDGPRDRPRAPSPRDRERYMMVALTGLVRRVDCAHRLLLCVDSLSFSGSGSALR